MSRNTLRIRMRLSAIAFLLLTVACSNTETEVPTFRSIAEEINGHYAGSWFSSVAFSQYAFHYTNNTVTDTQIWHEAYLYPGKLIIKYDSIRSGSGLLFRNDSMYEIRNDSVLSVVYMPQDLIVLTMDMFRMRPDEMIQRVSQLGYDTSALCRGKYKGKPVYIVGVKDSSDTSKKQFWLDEYNFFCYKVIMQREYGTREVIFDDILTKNGKWIEQEVIFMKNGQIDMKEEYFNITFNFPVDSSVFNPVLFSAKQW